MIKTNDNSMKVPHLIEHLQEKSNPSHGDIRKVFSASVWVQKKAQMVLMFLYGFGKKIQHSSRLLPIKTFHLQLWQKKIAQQ